jgi:hypothetical protein
MATSVSEMDVVTNLLQTSPNRTRTEQSAHHLQAGSTQPVHSVFQHCIQDVWKYCENQLLATSTASLVHLRAMKTGTKHGTKYEYATVPDNRALVTLW